MKAEELSDAIGEMDEKYVVLPNGGKNAAGKKNTLIKIIAAAACFALIIAAVGLILPKPEKKLVDQGENTFDLTAKTPGTSAGWPLIAAAVLPDRAKMPVIENYADESAYYDALSEYYQNEAPRQVVNTPDGMKLFYKNLISAALTGEENEIVAPANLASLLGILSECTDGNSRAQILNALGFGDIGEVRDFLPAMWDSLYTDNGVNHCRIANSLWLSDGIKYKDGLKQISSTYYCDSFSGDMTSPDYSAVLREWLNEKTDGLLTGLTGDISFDPRTVLAAASTVAFSYKWDGEFSETQSRAGVFHGKNGDSEKTFMHGTTMPAPYAELEDCTVCGKFLSENGGTVWFILPDEGVSVADVLDSGSFFKVTENANGYTFPGKVELTVPKFDVAGQSDVSDVLKKLGITDVFDPSKADFSPVIEKSDMSVFLGEISHGARVEADERGVKGSAYSLAMMCGAGLPPEETKTIVLDRPFIFLITSPDGIPLFAGVLAD